ncbi:MAG: hypothetical protein A3A33_00325 [Candidatus Yanofskybacteria bacterium RIFCSPLOWO2_01_FULL_49_25]|uniref:Zinc-binding domain-containing protein n=1 Tax=Candidatus Yanofskybacteria bacterium RIFCSPLOWO2_01_FULL_49_25 TaxID=1802701 RepID=A0A1F8GSP6_9BACT|nr:MAG: hypothetical protein A3A33_00325 [Candidatus Yanofskybacteria bacterium RIFCSPLOWO2_01_FULL_49_25]
MNNEQKQCQNCKQSFTVESVDFDFYAKMSVPAPTFCPECRFQRRLMFRNERVLYKRDCDLCGKNVVSIFSPEKPFPVYCQPCWWSDKWDDGDFYHDYDPSRNIFEQMKELQKKTPHMALISDYSSLVNSEYVNHVGDLKNCYLIFNADFNENVSYANVVIRTKDSMDVQLCGNGELLYECININSYNCAFSHTLEKCTNVLFSRYLIGCQNCFGCVNLRGKSYYIFNEPYSKEEYSRKLKEFRLDTWSGLQKAKSMADAFWIKHPYRYMEGSPQNINSTGDYVFYAKNALDCFQVNEIEDSRYCQFITMKTAKDCYDYTEWGQGAQRVVDSLTVGKGADYVKYCALVWHSGTMNLEYDMYNVWCNNNFACINLKHKQYRILNKQYTEDEYKKLRAEIIKNMNEKPYVDSKGRVWKYGEFLPYDLSPFAYNETQAIQYWPLSENQIKENGWTWREPTKPNYQITMPADQMPDSIHDVQDSILNEILGCEKCGKAFRLIAAELQLLRRWEFPIPRYCPDCRHMDRLARINPPRLYNRVCARCNSPTRTSYAPDRPEVIYCGECYQQEIA